MGEGWGEGEMRKSNTNFAKILRRNQTPQEGKLWRLLKAKNINNVKFRRQFPIGKYIVDFCCPERKLIIEVDGGGHNIDNEIKRDEERDKFFKKEGFIILRFWNNEVDRNIEGVYQKVIDTIALNSPSP